MFAKSKIAAIALTAGLVVSSNAQAVEVSLETYVTKLVNQAMTVTQQELQNSLTESVVNTAQKMNFTEGKAVKTKITITDIKSKKIEVTKVASL
jgi:DNA-directed RNA polymerase subunit E'/Rpb7